MSVYESDHTSLAAILMSTPVFYHTWLRFYITTVTHFQTEEFRLSELCLSDTPYHPILPADDLVE